MTGATAEHGKRVAWITWLCASKLGLRDDEIVNLIGCAVLHDNAVTEYLREEVDIVYNHIETEHSDVRSQYGDNSVHAYIGEQNAHILPFSTDMTNVILYHHEKADGTGPFGKKADETNLFSQIIHISDRLDVAVDLPHITEAQFDEVRESIKKDTGTTYSKEVSDLFLQNVSWKQIKEMQTEGPLALLKRDIPVIIKDYTDIEMSRIAQFFAMIVDSKSSFTKNHSIGVAQKAETMAKHYGFAHEKIVRFVFAGAVHDIGKMVVGNDILEKPDKLDAGEFSQMKNHAAETYKILSSIQRLEDITEWASNHHEKLDGTGYSRRLSAEQLSFEDRLMACIDIYQALTEKRPYKDGLSHNRSIAIMRDMAQQGKIDLSIVNEIDLVFGKDAVDEVEPYDVKLTTKKWKCSVCGYVYEGDTPPASCPICDSDMDQFELMD